MPRSLNRLEWATSGDAGDVRLLRLTGAPDLLAANTIEGWVWKAGTDQAEFTVTAADSKHVNVDLGTWLATDPTPVGQEEWWVKIQVDGVTWPGAKNPAILPVRAAS